MTHLLALLLESIWRRLPTTETAWTLGVELAAAFGIAALGFCATVLLGEWAGAL